VSVGELAQRTKLRHGGPRNLAMPGSWLAGKPVIPGSKANGTWVAARRLACQLPLATLNLHGSHRTKYGRSSPSGSPPFRAARAAPILAAAAFGCRSHEHMIDGRLRPVEPAVRRHLLPDTRRHPFRTRPGP